MFRFNQSIRQSTKEELLKTIINEMLRHPVPEPATIALLGSKLWVIRTN